MRILIVSSDGKSLGLGVRLMAEGHTVGACVVKTDSKHKCDGIIPKIRSACVSTQAGRPVKMAVNTVCRQFKPDLVLCMEKELCTVAKAFGVPTVSSGSALSTIEQLNTLDPVLPTITHGRCGDKTYWIGPVPSDPVIVGCWYDGHSVRNPYIAYEFGNIDCFVEHSANVVLIKPLSFDSSLSQEVCERLPFGEYKGLAEVKVCLGKDSIQCVGLSTSFTCPNTYAFFENVFCDTGQWLLDLATGRLEHKQLKDKWTIGVTIRSIQKVIYTLNTGALKHCWPCDLRKEEGQFYMSGHGDGLYLTALGDSPRKAAQRCLRSMGKLDLGTNLDLEECAREASRRHRQITKMWRL